MRPQQLLLGALAVGAASAAAWYASKSQSALATMQRRHPVAALGVILGVAYSLTWLFGSAAVFLLSVALPLASKGTKTRVCFCFALI